MNTVILTDEQLAFLQTLVSHDTDLLEPLVRGADLSFDTTEDDFDTIALRDLMSTTANALCGIGLTAGVYHGDVYAFHGTREHNAGEFVIDCDRSLDEGPNVLTARCLDRQSTFMGWVWGGDNAKFVEVPQHLAGRIGSCIDVTLSDEENREFAQITTDDIEAVEQFVAALRRIAQQRHVPMPKKTREKPPTWEIVGPYGLEWTGEAEDELAALDAWATSMEMETYSEAILRNVREGDGPSAFRIAGVMNATHSNYNVEVRERLVRDVIVHLRATVVDHVDDDNTVQQRLLEAIDAIQADGVDSIDVTLVEDA